ncbi:MAG: hypothetical protein RML75_18115 [Cyanobacteriota bacterium SKYGB_h_bin112]|nr:hypothetical protein [Cyanobacteriota bacterium SKYGB_h_bin112]
MTMPSTTQPPSKSLPQVTSHLRVRLLGAMLASSGLGFPKAVCRG